MRIFRRRDAGDEYLSHLRETSTNPTLRAAVDAVEQERSELIPAGFHVVWTECCGYLPNSDGVGAPVYLLAGEQHMAEVEVATHPTEQSGG